MTPRPLGPRRQPEWEVDGRGNEVRAGKSLPPPWDALLGSRKFPALWLWELLPQRPAGPVAAGGTLIRATAPGGDRVSEGAPSSSLAGMDANTVTNPPPPQECTTPPLPGTVTRQQE